MRECKKCRCSYTHEEQYKYCPLCGYKNPSDSSIYHSAKKRLTEVLEGLSIDKGNYMFNFATHITRQKHGIKQSSPAISRCSQEVVSTWVSVCEELTNIALKYCDATEGDKQ